MNNAISVPNIFGAWNCSFTYVPAMLGKPLVNPLDQVTMLSELGYDGVAILDTQKLPEFAATPQVQNDSFRILAACIPVDLSAPTSHAEIEAAARALQALGGDMWMIMSNLPPPPIVRERINEVADIAAAHSVQLVLYPHFGTALTNAENGVRWIRNLGREELKVALNISHEFKVGNSGRLSEVIRNVGPFLGAVTINGADRDVLGEEVEGTAVGYDRSIQALGDGDFDVYREYLVPLMEHGYSGPIILHDLVTTSSVDHFRRSMEVWKRWVGRKIR